MELLFSKGRSFTAFPLKIFYLQPGEKLDFFIKAGVGVSGKTFKKAVERNHIKRLLREAYRTEKTALHQFLLERGMQLVIFILYIDKTPPVYKTIKEKMPFVFKRLMKELNEKA